MRVLILNGSPHKNGNTSIALNEINMVFLMKSIALGKEKYGLPEKEARISTNFVR